MTIQPTGDNIVIKIEVQEEVKQTKSGIVLPASQTPQAKPDKGEVVAVGTGRILNSGLVIEPGVKVGDYIIFNRFAGTELAAGDEKFLIIKENDVLAIITE